ncbi:MAG: chemotaxis protein CheB, partial [Chloroflexota bacterium]
MAETDQVGQLVAVGASAGGIEALGTLLSMLPVDLQAAVVIAQHIDPSKISHLPEILQRQTPLRVKSVSEREPLQAGVVYLVPADRHVSITDHEVSLSTDSQERPKPSVNLLLSTASHTFGERLVAVILSGTGSDGALGAESVKRAGGTVIIQNPETARYGSMPRSLAPGVVDIVADLEDIGPIIAQLVAGEYEEPSEADAERDVQGFLEELRIRRGIDFNSYKPATIRRRLQRRRAAVGAANLPAYRAYLDQHPEEINELVRTFLIKVTDFFRDQELFAYLRERLIPRLVLDSRRRNNQLRVWSAGCATGQEAYSLAILIAEVLGNDMESFGVRVFATDLDAEAVE